MCAVITDQNISAYSITFLHTNIGSINTHSSHSRIKIERVHVESAFDMQQADHKVNYDSSAISLTIILMYTGNNKPVNVLPHVLSHRYKWQSCSSQALFQCPVHGILIMFIIIMVTVNQYLVVKNALGWLCSKAIANSLGT